MLHRLFVFYCFAPSGIMEDIQIFLQDIESSIAQIRNVTGINEVADGTTQQQDMLQSVMQGLNNATNSTLRPHFRVYENHHLLLAEYTVLKWQIAVLKGDISAIYAPFGDNSLKTVVATKDLYDYDFGIRLSIKANSQERQMLMQDISAAKQQGQISLPNYILLWNMIMTGDLKKAQLYYAKAVEHEKAVQHQAQLEQLKAQGEANGNAAKIAEDAKTQNQILLLEAQTKLEQVKGEEARKTEMVKHENKMKELQVQAGHNIIQTTVDNAMSNLANTQQQGNTPTVPTT